MATMLNPRPTTMPSIEVDELTAAIAETRRLWDHAPTVSSAEREAVVCELIDLELSLERIALRSRWQALDRDDHAEVERCAERLDKLARHWRRGRSPGPVTVRRN